MTQKYTSRHFASRLKHFLQCTMRALGGVATTELAVRWNTSLTRRAMRFINSIQLSDDELAAITAAICARTPCNLLVFGAGHDTRYWTSVVGGGSCVILEDNSEWLESVKRRNPLATVVKVEYGTLLRDAALLVDAPDRLAMQLPEGLRQMKWDVILVDAPAGYAADLPGRMQSIYEASRLIAERGVVFVHDCDRLVEVTYSRRYLSHGTELRISHRLLQYSFCCRKHFAGLPVLEFSGD